MRATNTFGVHFTLRQSKRNDSKSNLYARITVNKTRCEISLKTNVKREDWNERKGSAKPKNDELKQLNSYLEEIRAKLVSHYREIKLANGLLSADVIKNAYSSAGNNNDSKSLLWLAEEHNKVMQEIIKPGTMKNYYTTARYLGYFLSQKFPSGDISLEELKCEFITAFEYFIRCNAIKKNDPCTNNGTMKHLERLKKMITWAFKNEWIKKNPFANFQLKFKHTGREYLNIQEMTTIENYELSKQILKTVRAKVVLTKILTNSAMRTIKQALVSHQLLISDANDSEEKANS